MNVDKQSKDRRYGKPPYAAVCLLESGESEVICLHGGLRLYRLAGAATPISDEWRKTLDLFWNFLYCVSAFRSRKVVVSFPPPEKREISADIRSECLYGFEVMDFGYCSCG